MSDDAKVAENGDANASLDALIECKTGDLPGMLIDRIDAGESTVDEAIQLFCCTLHAVILAFVSIFPADRRRGVAVGLIMRISRTVLAADELTGGAREKSLH